MVRQAGKSTWAKAAAIALLILIVDLATKAVASGALDLHETRSLLPFLNISLVHNPGINFLLDQYIPIYIAAAVALYLAVSIIRQPPKQVEWITGLLCGGAVGNLLERAYHGYVTDFLEVQGTAVVFNLADVALILACLLYYAEQRDNEETVETFAAVR